MSFENTKMDLFHCTSEKITYSRILLKEPYKVSLIVEGSVKPYKSLINNLTYSTILTLLENPKSYFQIGHSQFSTKSIENEGFFIKLLDLEVNPELLTQCLLAFNYNLVQYCENKLYYEYSLSNNQGKIRLYGTPEEGFIHSNRGHGFSLSKTLRDIRVCIHDKDNDIILELTI